MNSFSFYSPTYFAFGEGQEGRTGELVKRFGGTKVLLHYGGGSIKKNGVYDAVTASLKAAGVSYIELGGVAPNPRSGLVYTGIDLCRREGVDYILAVGGGSTIDSSKAIAVGVNYDGDFWDYFEGKYSADKVLPSALCSPYPPPEAKARRTWSSPRRRATSSGAVPPTITCARGSRFSIPASPAACPLTKQPAA